MYPYFNGVLAIQISSDLVKTSGRNGIKFVWSTSMINIAPNLVITAKYFIRENPQSKPFTQKFPLDSQVSPPVTTIITWEPWQSLVNTAMNLRVHRKVHCCDCIQ